MTKQHTASTPGLQIDRCSLKNEVPVTVPWGLWFSYPFGTVNGSVVEYEDPLGWHSPWTNPERITPNVTGEGLVAAKFNLRDLDTCGAVEVSTRFARAANGKPLDVTWTDDVRGPFGDGLWCHTANGPQKSITPGVFWVAQIRLTPGPASTAAVPVVCELAEFILTGWHS